MSSNTKNNAKPEKDQYQQTTDLAAESKGVTKESHASAEEIARRAYEIYLERGGAHGNDLDDWLQAEHELRGINNNDEGVSK